MKLELLTIICFALASSAGEDSLGMAALLMALCFVFGFLAANVPHKKRKERKKW